MIGELPLVDIDALVNPVGRVTVQKIEYAVLPASGRIAELLQQLAQAKAQGDNFRGGLSFIDVARECVHEAVPSLPDVALKALNIDQLTAIVAIATRQQDSVKELIKEHEKNAGGPKGGAPAVTRPPSARRSSTK